MSQIRLLLKAQTPARFTSPRAMRQTNLHLAGGHRDIEQHHVGAEQCSQSPTRWHNGATHDQGGASCRSDRHIHCYADRDRWRGAHRRAALSRSRSRHRTPHPRSTALQGYEIASPGQMPPVVSYSVGDAETAAASLNVVATSSNTNLVPNANLTLGGSGSAARCR